ncbi:hypothetical protein [Lysobacter terrae]
MASWRARTGLAIACALLLMACNREAAPVTTQEAKPSPTSAQAPPPAAEPQPVAAKADEATASLVLPGSFAPDSTPDSLRQTFGAANVQIGDVPGAEGESSRGVILFPDDATRRAYLYFQDADKLHGLLQVRVFEPESQWRMGDGIKIGTTLAELAKRNGKPITFSGFGWDYGGAVQDLHGGALTAQREGPVIRSWRLGPREAAKENDYPTGDASFRSDDPHYPKQGEAVVVSELWVSFPGEDDL